MISEKETTALSKFLSLVLRHQPETIDIKLDEQGWVTVDELLRKAQAHGKNITPDVLNHIVETNTKKRFAFDDTGKKIRASQGHSVDVELGYEPQMPPDVLYHGTGSQSVDAILQSGLEKRSRQHVHLSSDLDTAVKVGQRHGKPVILTVAAGAMHLQGHRFYLSANNVWLTDFVPAGFIGRHSS
ncbi:putative RNA 2'-phosphotransferase [Mucilaginibacter gossypiicola]|uniref:Probable RNA 2'-phosphotransferase n=1 Tax=Mucilaginibacter gossypiicola TaxID=551995 RepID=A0A1H8JCG5_9SPHI|nr:RNA 2'-phosphotransferase [Mucilaginibacter gossypiicola]SEN78553.1 putative RNA 2'-phosphotransferase [Mucilaginibacter gossypiicola]